MQVSNQLMLCVKFIVLNLLFTNSVYKWRRNLIVFEWTIFKSQMLMQSFSCSNLVSFSNVSCFAHINSFSMWTIDPNKFTNICTHKLSQKPSRPFQIERVYDQTTTDTIYWIPNWTRLLNSNKNTSSKLSTSNRWRSLDIVVLSANYVFITCFHVLQCNYYCFQIH